MRKYVLVVVGVLVAEAIATLVVLRSGYVPFVASTSPSAVETRLARMALDASLRRSARTLHNPLPATEANLMQGMQIYKVGCANCHGAPGQKNNVYGRSFYPPAPQFNLEPPRRTEGEIYYITKHGVRMTGMAAWGNTMEEEQIWKVAAFLNRLESLPPAVAAEWHKPPR